MKTKYTNIHRQDFPSHSILYEVAKIDIMLACRLAEEFGGTNQYIHHMSSIERSIRNRLIMKRASKLEGRGIIAKDVGLCEGYVRQIIRKTIRSSMEKKFLKNN